MAIEKCYSCKSDKQYFNFLCDNCLEELRLFSVSLYPSKKRFMFDLIEDLRDKVAIYRKSLWQTRRKQLKIIRNTFNKKLKHCSYIIRK